MSEIYEGGEAQEEAKVEEVPGKEHDIDYADPEAAAQQKVGGLKDVAVVKGTEGESCVYKQRIKLFRFRDN